MKFSEKWLREWVNPHISTEQLSSQLTMAGLEVDSIQEAGAVFTRVITGAILSIKPHPQAEKLLLCDIDIGLQKPITVVTNVKTLVEGMKVIVATEGAYLPGIHKANEKLIPGEIRGVFSEGMLCSTQELALGAQAEGIWVLPNETPVGQDFYEYLNLSDKIIELDLTPNRGDCLSMVGIAREIATINKVPMTAVKIDPIKSVIPDVVDIQLDAFEDCPRYAGRIIRGLKPAQTPLWLQEKLRRSDIRSIHPVVDVLNYVMLELGQPMHAFDLGKLNGGIVVRHAIPGEKISLLDGQEVTLQAKTLVIADKQEAHAIAGIMGGSESAVQEYTQDILLESALFTPHLIAGKARAYSLHTDSSFRFERGVNPNLQTLAIERATSLILQICGGKCGPIMDVVKEEFLPKQNNIELRYARIEKMLGHAVPEDDVVDILQRLGCILETSLEINKKWQVRIPGFRYDLTSEIDLIEEVLRIFGFDNIPTKMPTSQLQFIASPQTDVAPERIKRALVDLGYQEVITYSFVDHNLQKMLFPQNKALPLVNPISADMNVMRLSIWPGLLSTLKYNQNRQLTRMKIFEVGMRFQIIDDSLVQDNVVSGLVCGNISNEHWDLKTRATDFYDVKQHIEALWLMLGQTHPLEFEASTHPACHSGQCAQISWQGEVIGILGKCHPKVQKQLELDGPIYLFEIKLSAFAHAPLPVFERPSRFPENRRDIAVIVDEKISSDNLISFVRNTAGELLRNVIVFDVYTGKGIDIGRKSIAMGLILQHPSRTLVDKEIDDVIQTVVAGLEKEFSAKLRE